MDREPGILDTLSLLSEVAEELVIRTVRDTHLAWVDRVHGLLDRPAGGGARVTGLAHRAIAGSVYGGIGLGLRATTRGLGAAGTAGLGPRLEGDRRGRFLSSAVNGLIGDRLEAERPSLAITMAVRRDGRDVALDHLAAAFPDATGRVAVFLHGLCENEDYFGYRRREVGTTYAENLAARGWTPVFLRANSGLPLRANGVALTALLQRLTDAWPVPVERIALVGHSLGGLVMRAACAVSADAAAPWVDLVTDVVTLGTPHLGSPVARGVGHASRQLARLPELAAFGRILDWRSVGVHDLVEGLSDDVPPLPRARYRLVSATLTGSPGHPVGAFLGDLLVRQPSAYGRTRGGEDLFPDATVLHVGRADHFDLLNHPAVHQAMEEWLA
jgi:hypothetical protein